MPKDRDLTLFRMAEKHFPYTGIGLRRPQAMTIVAGTYTRHRVLSLVPAYEVCVFVCVSGEGPGMSTQVSQ